MVAFASTSKIDLPGRRYRLYRCEPRGHRRVLQASEGRSNQCRQTQPAASRAFPSHYRGGQGAHEKARRVPASALRVPSSASSPRAWASTGCATWTHPRGGYFVCFDGPEGSAQKRVGALCAELGVKLTHGGRYLAVRQKTRATPTSVSRQAIPRWRSSLPPLTFSYLPSNSCPPSSPPRRSSSSNSTYRSSARACDCMRGAPMYSGGLS